MQRRGFIAPNKRAREQSARLRRCRRVRAAVRRPCRVARGGCQEAVRASAGVDTGHKRRARRAAPAHKAPRNERRDSARALQRFLDCAERTRACVVSDPASALAPPAARVDECARQKPAARACKNGDHVCCRASDCRGRQRGACALAMSGRESSLACPRGRPCAAAASQTQLSVLCCFGPVADVCHRHCRH
eukprot:Amastigsp_a188267_5.p3 type:complete len:191 gc:universal Amastigsp_a188267_5:778-206(-)